MMVLFYFIVLGLIVGSFANMLAHRLPRIYQTSTQDKPLTLWLPRSHCPACQTPIPLVYLLPVIGFVLCRGRCVHCQCAIAWRYIALELGCALVPVVLFALSAHWQHIALGSLLCWWLITLAVIDYENGILPDELTLTGMWVGLLINAMTFPWFDGTQLPLFVANAAHSSWQLTSLTSAVYGAALGYGIPWVINWLFYFIRRRQGMGYGDFKMLAMIGAWLGVFDMLLTLFAASIIGIVLVCLRALVLRVPLARPIAFGVCIALAAILLLFLNLLDIDITSLLLLI